MATSSDISQSTKATQERIFRIAQRNGLTLKAISLDSGIPYSTIRGYAGHSGEPTEMPISAVAKLVGVIPDELLSLLLPEGRAIVAVPSEIDHDEVEKALLDFAATKAAFHHPDSECGRELGPNETATLNDKIVRLPILGRAA